MGTGNAEGRRKNTFFFEKYCRGKGIDIGCHRVKVLPEVDGFDKQDFPGVIRGDATFMEPIADETYDWVYSSHCLEHIVDVDTALENWWRILRHGGYLILVVPHQDYYERKHILPSVYNGSHKHFFLPFESVGSDTLSLYELIRKNLDDGFIIYLNECSNASPVHRADPAIGYSAISVAPECSIEAVIQKGEYKPVFDMNYG